MHRDFIPVCQNHPEAFDTATDRVSVNNKWSTVADRTQAVDAALRRIAEKGHITAWRDEPFAAVTAPGEAPLLFIERAAAARFGILGIGVHLNGYRSAADGVRIWMARRAADRAVAPGKWDQIVAGGQPAHLSLRENLIKESAEEADLPESLVRQARPVGAISYRMQRPNGLRRDILYIYDLPIPASVVPRNTDGEVECFELWSLAQVQNALETTEDFKFNCALVFIDFLIRHGHLPPEYPDYLDLLKGLRGHDGRLE